MTAQTLTAFERQVVSGLAYKASLAATLLDAWADLPVDSVQSIRSLIDHAQLGVTEERATRELLEKAVNLGLIEAVSHGFCPRNDTQGKFRRLALALNSIDYYRSSVHRDATLARVVLTRPPRPSILEQRLSDLGWRTSDLEPTNHAFHSMVRAAQRRVVVMTPFLDKRGAIWLQELLSYVAPDVERTLVLRGLEDPSRRDYPVGFGTIASWLETQGVRVFNYSIPRVDDRRRETFHAKVVLCDRDTAYLGSSNVTAASLDHSMEMGVVLQGSAATDVAEVIDAVLASATQEL